MATEIEALLLQIEANTKKLEKDMAKANLIVDQGLKKMERQAKQLGDKLGGHIADRLALSARSAMVRLGGLVATAFSAEKVLEASQAYIRASNALKVAGLSGTALTDTFGKLYDIAQANGAPIETLVGLYSKAAQVQTALGASSSQLIDFTTAVAQSLRVSGTSAEEAQGALLQMGQALGSGTVHAEEYNSMLEGAYPILQAAAAGIKEAGGEVSKLTTLVKDGQVSSKAFFYGVLAGAPTLTDKLSGSTETVAQAWTKFENALIKAVGEVDAATGATKGLAEGLGSLVPWLEKTPAMIEWATEKWKGFKGAVDDASGALNRLMGYDSAEVLKAAGLVPIEEERATRAREALAKATKNPNTTGGGFGGDAEAVNKRVADAFALLDKPKSTVKPVSLKDYPATGKTKKGGGGGAESEDEYDRAIRRAQEATEAARVEASAIGLSAEARDKAKKSQELLTAAKQADKELTPQILSEIDATAAAYAKEEEQLRRLEKAHDDAAKSAQYLSESAVDAFSDIVIDGKNAAEVAQNLAKALARAALQALLLGSGPLSGLFGGGLFGSLGSLFTGGATGGPMSLFPHASGGVMTSRGPAPLRAYAGGGVASSPQVALYGEGSRPEAFVPLPDGRSIPVSLRLPSPNALGPMPGGPSITFAPVVDAKGSGAAEIARLEAALRRLAADIPSLVRQTQHRDATRGVY